MVNPHYIRLDFVKLRRLYKYLIVPQCIKLYDFAFYILGVSAPFYTFKLNKVQCSVPHNIHGMKFHLNSINLLF